jgi:hypothetical protein
LELAKWRGKMKAICLVGGGIEITTDNGKKIFVAIPASALTVREKIFDVVWQMHVAKFSLHLFSIGFERDTRQRQIVSINFVDYLPGGSGAGKVVHYEVREVEGRPELFPVTPSL